MALRQSTAALARISTRMMQLGDPGSGAGKSGGSGGSIRDAGGAFGKMEAAREGEYFHKLQQKQLAQLKAHVKEELEHSQAQIAKHQETLQRNKERLAELENFETKTKE